LAQSDIELFQGLQGSLKDEITKYGQVVRFEKRETVFESDDLLQWFYILMSGKVKVFQMNLATSREQTIFLLSRGDMFDTISLLDGKYHEVMNESLEAGEALRLPIEKVRQWIKEDPDFNHIFFPYIAKQMRQIEELATDISLYSTSQRLIKLILKEHKDSGRSLLNGLSHTEMANLIGTVRHVIERLLKELKLKDIIDIKQRKITVKDLKDLQKKVNDL